jgi:hypothetical protein
MQLEMFLDHDALLADWLRRGLNPGEAAVGLTPIDVAIATWLAGLTASTRKDYAATLRSLARELDLDGVTDGRTLLVWVVQDPDRAEAELRAHRKRTSRKAATDRKALIVLDAAFGALVQAGQLSGSLDLDLPPKDEDVDVTPAPRDLLERAADLATREPSALNCRTLVVIHLLWRGLRIYELGDVCIGDLQHNRRTFTRFGLTFAFDRHAWDAVTRWLKFRGNGPGPLLVGFVGRSGRTTATAPTARNIQRDVSALGDQIGAPGLTPTQVRRRAVIAAFEVGGVSASLGVARLANPADIWRWVERPASD